MIACLGNMSTAAEQLEQHPHIQAIRRYYDACTAGDAAGVAACCTSDVVHYFLGPGAANGAERSLTFRLGRMRDPVRGSADLGRVWHEFVQLISAEWRVEHAIACDDEAVIEWSMQWTSRDDGERYIVHGAEWYAFRDDLISEIRAYYDWGRNQDTGLVDFPYAERGYAVVERSRTEP